VTSISAGDDDIDNVYVDYDYGGGVGEEGGGGGRGGGGGK